jgi:hypothetical protein
LSARDIYPKGGNRLRDEGEQSELILRVDGDSHPAGGSNSGIPFNIDLPHHIAAQYEGTLSVMHRYSSTPCNEANNSVARKGLTTLRESHKDIIEPRDPNTNPVPTNRSGPLEDPLQRRGLRFKFCDD